MKLGLLFIMLLCVGNVLAVDIFRFSGEIDEEDTFEENHNSGGGGFSHKDILVEENVSIDNSTNNSNTPIEQNSLIEETVSNSEPVFRDDIQFVENVTKEPLKNKTNHFIGAILMLGIISIGVIMRYLIQRKLKK